MIRLFKHGKVNNRGDTIIEVLIAMGVVSLVLAGAYVSSNRSFQAVRTAQERGEALKLAESQVEQVKIAADSGLWASPSVPPASFCFDTLGHIQITPPLCVAGSVKYKIDINSFPNPTYTDFTVKIQWDALGGGTNTAELDYRTQK